MLGANSKDAVRELLLLNGWETDNWGHLQKTMQNGSKYRVKLQEKVVRIERQVYSQHDNKNSWMRVVSEYYGKITLAPNHKGAYSLGFGSHKLALKYV